MNRALIQIADLANPRDVAGNQLYRDFAIFGKAPASPTPNKNWTTTRNPKPAYTPPGNVQPVKPVSATNKAHHITTRNSVDRGPRTSPSQPDGTSKMAYAH